MRRSAGRRAGSGSGRRSDALRQRLQPGSTPGRASGPDSSAPALSLRHRIDATSELEPPASPKLSIGGALSANVAVPQAAASLLIDEKSHLESAGLPTGSSVWQAQVELDVGDEVIETKPSDPGLVPRGGVGPAVPRDRGEEVGSHDSSSAAALEAASPDQQTGRLATHLMNDNTIAPPQNGLAGALGAGGLAVESNTVELDARCSSSSNVERLPTSDSPGTGAEPAATFPSEDADTIWSQLIQRVPDALSYQLRNAARVAISGPNVLEVHFPESYLFCMTYCQRPESLGQLAKASEAVAGRQFTFNFYADVPAAGGVSGPTSPAARREDGRLRPKVVDNEPFVQTAVAIFGGTVVDVRKAPAEVRSTLTDPEDVSDSEPDATELASLDDPDD